MKYNSFETASFPDNKNISSNILLTNCGFSPDFFNTLEENILIMHNNKIKKNKSENDIILLKKKEEKIQGKKIYEAEDKDIYKKINNNTKKVIYSNINNSSFKISSLTTIPSQDYLNKNNSEIINKKNNNNYIVKAYKSNLKKKYNHLYEINSIELAKINKSKLYHKCCYPNCNRTFSSSGWLKAHLKNHLKQIHNSKYCKLFESYVLNEHFLKMSRKNNNLCLMNNKNVNNINNINNISNNVSLNNDICDIEKLFSSNISFTKPAISYYNNENNSNLNLFINNNLLDLNNFNNIFFQNYN